MYAYNGLNRKFANVYPLVYLSEESELELLSLSYDEPEVLSYYFTCLD